MRTKLIVGSSLFISLVVFSVSFLQAQSGLAQYALYDEKTHKLYILAPQSFAVAFLGEHIKVTGALAPSPMSHGAQTVDPNTNEVKDLHRVGQDTATSVAGVLTITSIAAAPFPARATPPAPKSGQ